MTTLGRMAIDFGKRIIGSQGLRVEAREAQDALTRFAQLSVTRLRTKRTLDTVTGDELLINFGSGALTSERWINVDIEGSNGAYFADLRDPLPLKDGSAAHIHCEHFLEHLDFHFAGKFLAECHRVLRAGGTMRIVVPDAGKYFRAYASNDRAFFDQLRELGNPGRPFRTPMEVINQMCRMAGAHKFAWDAETLELATREAGFTRFELSQRGAMQPGLDIDGTDWWREVESLYCVVSKA